MTSYAYDNFRRQMPPIVTLLLLLPPTGAGEVLRSRSSTQPPAPAEEPEWLESVLGASKEGVFTADFLSKNGTTVSVRDGGTAILDCRVYLRHDKTVGEHEICIQFLPAARR